MSDNFNQFLVKSKSKLNDAISVVAILILLIVFTIINPRFLGLKNISNLLGDMSTLLIMSIGVTFILIIGSIDLSVGAVSSAAAVIFVMTLPALGGVSIPLTLLFGAFTGLVSGFIYTKVKVPSFIVTFGTMSIWNSIAMLVSNGASQQINRQYYGLINWYKIKLGVFPLPFLVAIILVALMLVIQSRTAFGKSMYAIGGNENAARTAGLNVTMTKMAVFVATGFFASLAGIMFASKLKSGIPTIGEPFTLMAIASVALGGTSLSGGKGGLLKTIAGVVLITLIQNGMNVIGISAFWQQTTFGIIILIAVYLTTDRMRRQLIVK